MAAGPVLVVDFGAQYAQLIARRVREANVYSELVPHSMPVEEMLAKKPERVIELAVKGMLPKGPLGRQMYTKLHVYSGAEHPHAAQKPEVLTF